MATQAKKETTKSQANELKIKKTIGIIETNEFINSVLDIVFGETDDGDDVYYPHLKDFAIRYGVLRYIGSVKIPTSPEKAWAYIYGKGEEDYKKIIESASPIFIETIMAAANEAVEWRKSSILKKNKLDELFTKAKRVLAAVEEKIGGLDMNTILEYVQKNAPELGDQIKAALAQEVNDNANAAPVDTNK